MSISFGSPATSTNLNNSFVSKTSDSTTIGKINLNAPDSGEEILNLQLEVNNKTFKAYDVEQITTGGEISSSDTMGMQRRKVISDGGTVTISSTPFGIIGQWIDGMNIRLRGNDDTNAIKLIHNDNDYGCILNGDIVLNKFVQITLEWDEQELRWYEISRNS